MKQVKKPSPSTKPATPAQAPAPDKIRGGRPRSFDPEPALDAAMLLFWEHGYEATSLAMLRDAMGLTPPQIYNAFTDKETLFRQALDRYHKTQVGFAIAALSAAIPTAAAIRQLLLGAAKTYTAAGKPTGCLFVSGALASYRLAAEAPVTRNLPEIALPGVLAKYDLPAIVTVLAPRPVVIAEPRDAAGRTLRRSQVIAIFGSAENVTWLAIEPSEGPIP